MTIALDELTIEELEALIIEAKAWIAKKQEEEVKSVYLQMVQLASGLGLSIDDVILRARRAVIFRGCRSRSHVEYHRWTYRSRINVR